MTIATVSTSQASVPSALEQKLNELAERGIGVLLPDGAHGVSLSKLRKMKAIRLGLGNSMYSGNVIFDLQPDDVARVIFSEALTSTHDVSLSASSIYRDRIQAAAKRVLRLACDATYSQRAIGGYCLENINATVCRWDTGTDFKREYPELVGEMLRIGAVGNLRHEVIKFIQRAIQVHIPRLSEFCGEHGSVDDAFEYMSRGGVCVLSLDQSLVGQSSLRFIRRFLIEALSSYALRHPRDQFATIESPAFAPREQILGLGKNVEQHVQLTEGTWANKKPMSVDSFRAIGADVGDWGRKCLREDLGIEGIIP